MRVDGSGRMEVDGTKPVPLPRNVGTRDEPPPFIPHPPPNKNKPVPLPRKLLPTQTPHISAVSSEGEEALETQDRATINIFKLANQLQDPFDNDFEKWMAEAEIQSAEPPSHSPHQTPAATTTEPMAGWEEDHYMDPPPPRPLTHQQNRPLSLPSSRTNPSLPVPPLPTFQEEDLWTGLGGGKGQQVVPDPTPSPSPPSRSAEAEAVRSDDGIYEPISSYSSSSSSDSINTPFNSGNRSNATNPTVPFIPPNHNFANAKRVTVPNVEKLFHEPIPSSKPDRLVQRTFDLEDVISKKEEEPRNRTSIASSTETTDSFTSYHRRSNVDLCPSSSNRSSSNSNTNENSPSSGNKVHDYDEVAIDDGTVILLDSSNSNSSLTSRNSVIAEFDPLLTPEPALRKYSQQHHSSNDLSNTCTLNLNDEEQHRYEYIDTDPEEDGSHSLAESSTFEEMNIKPCPREEVDGRRSTSSKWTDNDLKSDNSNDSSQDRYELVSTPPDLVLEDPDLPPLSDQVSQREESSEVGLSNALQVPDAATSLVNQSSFFRRFSSKFRLNSIKEERDGLEKKDGLCGKCLMEHLESGRCKFIPSCRPTVLYSSNLYKAGGIGRKDFVKKRVVLARGKLSFYNEKSDVISEVPLEKLIVIWKRDDHRVSPNFRDLKYFELGLVNWKSSSMVLAGGTEAERATWMEKYIEAHNPTLPLHLISNFDGGGWCFMKETVTSGWRPCWLILKERSLYYAYENRTEYYEMDLRKARSIVVSDKDESDRCGFVDCSEVLTVDLICKILYIQTESAKVTLAWQKGIQGAANLNGPTFQEMQLTLDNVPVILDKCIDFLYAHGTLAEGIYRQSGSNTRISQLLSEFQKDAWAVQISAKDFSAHDVAGTLKRFFRTLPEPLVTSAIYQDWIKAASMMKKDEKLKEYMRLLESLPRINYNIMKKLICHLYAVHELQDKNLMPLINLAPIWGPTLMTVDSSLTAQSYETACAECEVVKDLIQNYYALFRVEAEEIAREKKMQDALQVFHLGSTRRKQSGDMKFWIYLWDKDEASAINVTLTPQSTAQGIVHEICGKSQIRHLENVSLHEVICGKSLERALHPSEKVIESVLRWSIWDINERKNNFLILKKNTIYPQLVQYAVEGGVVVGDLKYAESKSKSFRKYTFHYSQPFLKYYKDSKSNTEMGSWKMEDMVWYMGVEPKRTPPTKWTFTLVKRNYPFKRSKEEPFFGDVIACSTEEELHKWLGALLIGEHPEGLYPSIII